MRVRIITSIHPSIHLQRDFVRSKVGGRRRHRHLMIAIAIVQVNYQPLLLAPGPTRCRFTSYFNSSELLQVHCCGCLPPGQDCEVEYRGERQKQRSPEVEFGGSCLAMAACVVQGVLSSRLLVPGAQALLPQHSSLSCGRVLEEPYHQSSVRVYSRALTSDVSSSGIERCTSAPRIGVRGRSRPVVCMAHPRRVKMVQQQIHRELADMLLHDSVLQQAVLPESGLGADMYLSSMATISDVDISNDLQVAKVFISIYGDEREQEIALEGLKSKAKYVRMGLGKRMSLRMTPEVRFVKDDSLERGSRVLDLLDKVKQDRERKERGETAPSQLITSVDDEDYDVDFDEEEEVAKPRTKKKSKAKSAAKPPLKNAKVVEDNMEWDDEEFRDLDFTDDENIIFIK